MENVINIEKINRAVMTGTPEEVIELCRFIHIESCFDYACEPPADFLEQCEKYWSGRRSFCPIALTRWTLVGKVMSLLLNIPSRLVITFLPRSKRLLISWLQSPSAVILEPPK